MPRFLSLGSAMRLARAVALCCCSRRGVPEKIRRIVHIDTGSEPRVVHEPVEAAPVQVGEDAFTSALTQLILDMRMDVAFRETEAADARGRVRSRTLLVSSKGLADSGTSGSSPNRCTRASARRGECLTW